MFTVIIDFLSKINDFIYFPVLVLLLIGVGLYFTFKTGFVQIANFKDALHTIFEKPEGEDSVSSFQALMISTASRVGTGNIVGISTAICLGGYGAVFWMWLVAIIGGASAFIESTLAQIYKKGSQAGDSYGGPSYYIENALHNRKLGLIFAICLILTYAVGFNMLASFNLRDSFEVYSFFDASVTPYIVGLILAVVTGYCLFGGNQRIIQFTSFLVPFMGIIYIAVALFMTLTNITILPEIIKHIVADAFNFTAISGGIAGSSLVYGIKRGLFSNEAGIGSAPNAAAAADVSHPVKQGLVQMMSVFIDTLIICSATAFMCLSSGIAPDPSLAGAPYVQAALSTVLGQYGNLFITISLVLFGFTTIIGNLYYVDNNLYYIFGKMPSRRFMIIFRSFCVLLIFLGAIQEASAAWLIADLLMAIMALINLPTILILSKTALAALKDYKQQRQRKQNPTFYAKNIGLDDSTLDYWK
ncbi:alanine/glycine:cation symporter family protein [Aerococcus kribbianus]|uniref:Alanine/glycine:cation symporter family protein n=1 Tax=Aerococcus kribbianus TaxID=2999064 RepID=A0A9X3JEF6_9LACT|nr:MULTISPECIES: alanine/glycine:cation symporter family protein [unclassified Aerococcus]MCZ0717064.1 alanine/glycine:cation symporter family protein [Aerococcus sp. YH-aer221]MCZ0725352.1 alanine/glycine:cation symporter family protein [Aerococcus sp. YH-aer222]